MSFPYWGDGKPLSIPIAETGGLSYWADGQPFLIISIQVLQTVSLTSSIATDEAFGTASLTITKQYLAPTGIATDETFETALVRHPIQTIQDFFYYYQGINKIIDGIPNNAVLRKFYWTQNWMGRPLVQDTSVCQNITPEGIESPSDPAGLGEDFGAPTIVPGLVVIQDFWYWKQTRGTIEVVVDGIPDESDLKFIVFGVTQGTPPTYLVKWVYRDMPWVGVPIIHDIFQVISRTISIESEENFGWLQVNCIIYPHSVESGEAFGAVEITKRSIEPPSIVSIEGFGTPQVNQTVYLVAIGPDDCFGIPRLELFLLPNAIGSDEAFGTALIVFEIKPVAVSPGEDFGQAKLVLTLLSNAIVSAEDVGVPQLNLILHPDSIVSAEYPGVPQLKQIIYPYSAEPGEEFGVPVTDGHIRLDDWCSIDSEEAFGTPRLKLFLNPVAIASEEDAGTPEAEPGPVWVYPLGIESGEGLGWGMVRRPREPSNLIVLEAIPLPTLEFADGLEEVDLYDSPLRMVVNG